MKHHAVPMRRTGPAGFATVDGKELDRQEVEQVLGVDGADESGTIPGEYSHDLEFGPALDLIRHHPDEVSIDLARVMIADAFSDRLPHLEFVGVNVARRQKGKVWLRVIFKRRDEDEHLEVEREVGLT